MSQIVQAFQGVDRPGDGWAASPLHQGEVQSPEGPLPLIPMFPQAAEQPFPEDSTAGAALG